MGGPTEPREPRGEGAGRPRDDDENFGFDDPAFNEEPEFRRRVHADGPGYAPEAGYSPDASYSSSAGYATEEYEARVFPKEELEGLGPEGGGGPRRVLPLEDEPTT